MIIYDVHDTIRQVDLPKKKKKPHITKRRNRLEVKNLDPQKIADCRRHRCKCLTKCASKFTFEDIERERDTYWKLDQRSQKQHLVDKLSFDLVADHDSQTVEFRYMVQHKQVCGSFFKALYPLSMRMYTDIRSRVRNKNTHVQPRKRTNSMQVFSQRIMDFLDKYAECKGEPQPNKTDIHFPKGIGKLDVYGDFLAEEFTADEKTPSISWFYNVWRHYRRQYKCPKWSTFSKCSICTDIKFQMEQGGGKEAKRKFLFILG